MTPDDSLLDFVTAVSGDQYVKVEENLGDGFVRLKVSEAERRQAKHDIRSVEDVVVELLRNSRDAHARRIWVASSREGDTRTLTVIDDGVGVPPTMRERIFEPRVTSKLETMVVDRWGVHGRGMALFSVKSNVEEARIVASDVHKGCSVVVVAATASLPERADQSRWPSVERDETGRLRVGTGPHNIVRRVVEFALEHLDVDVFSGTPTEVLASLTAGARSSLDSRQLLFCDDPSAVAVWQRPALAGDANDLVSLAGDIGLQISERTAHRVIAGEIASLSSVHDLVDGSLVESADRRPDIYRDRRGLQLHSRDVAEFQRRLEDAFDVVGERYYLHLEGEPKVRVGRDCVTVRFNVAKDD
jgi:hypothetical protein